MGDKYLDLSGKFKKRMKLVEDFNPDYYFLHDCCVDFFDKIEHLFQKKSIYFIKKFDFNSLYGLKANGEIYLIEKNYFILSEMLTLAIDKYGVDVVVKHLLPESIERAETSAFYTLLNIFLSLFRKAKINIKHGYGSSTALAEAVNDLRDLKSRKKLPSLDRGEGFSQALATLCLLVFGKYATPIKKSNYFEDDLKIAAKNKLIVESNLIIGKKWWDDAKSKSVTPSSSVYSDPVNPIYTEDDYLQERDDHDEGWSDSEWDDDNASQYSEPNPVSTGPIGTNEITQSSSAIEPAVNAPPPPPPLGEEGKISSLPKKVETNSRPPLVSIADELKQRTANLQKRNQKLQPSEEINESLLVIWKKELNIKLSYLNVKNATMSPEGTEALCDGLKKIKDVIISEQENLKSQFDIMLSMEDVFIKANKLRRKVSKYQKQHLELEDKRVSSSTEKLKKEKLLSCNIRKLEKAKTELAKLDKSLKKEGEQIEKYQSIYTRLERKLQLLEAINIKIKEAEKDETTVETKETCLQAELEQLEKKLNSIDKFIESVKQGLAPDSRLQGALQKRATANQVSSSEESALSAMSNSDWSDPEDKPTEKLSDTDSGHQSGSENESGRHTSESKPKEWADVLPPPSRFFQPDKPSMLQNNYAPSAATISHTAI